MDLRRFELLTSSMRTRRATNCAIGPDERKHYHQGPDTANLAGATRATTHTTPISRYPSPRLTRILKVAECS
ncbi:hypothetical protein PSCLAVI8L_180109 [Pseudoclavibacter sp. 8L]|nr:hypothetical protein PSCLAVI8L_180109 [Pseudoclavibacter sp. 8L]